MTSSPRTSSSSGFVSHRICMMSSATDLLVALIARACDTERCLSREPKVLREGGCASEPRVSRPSETPCMNSWAVLFRFTSRTNSPSTVFAASSYQSYQPYWLVEKLLGHSVLVGSPLMLYISDTQSPSSLSVVHLGMFPSRLVGGCSTVEKLGSSTMATNKPKRMMHGTTSRMMVLIHSRLKIMMRLLYNIALNCVKRIAMPSPTPIGASSKWLSTP
mmetsp:Transcript_12502/g.50062  ORF Transcript_12502/g.50062 Transcript_12502/m.50062 type:complete len:218 (-) Transcript_12502:112-765(-)